MNRKLILHLLPLLWFTLASLRADEAGPPRERFLMDTGWRFAFGNAVDPALDFDPAPAGIGFNYFAKAGAGAGAAAEDFDDRAWRELDLPHDWAVEAPFSAQGSASHGYKAIGKNFPARSIGWYRKTFYLPASDAGRRLTLEFDGVFRDSQAWVNGFYLGRESSGYTPFSYDLSAYLNYGGLNTVAVRVDASLEEGWFYEGAGLYRHVWLTKTSPLHVAQWGACVRTSLSPGSDTAAVAVQTTVNNDQAGPARFSLTQTILDPDGRAVASQTLADLTLDAGATGDFSQNLAVSHPRLWSLETPSLHHLVTTVVCDGRLTDRYNTTFGIRTIRWDANQGFFLNGRRVELKGTCDHQDAAGVGVAVPDAVNVYRVDQLKKMGSNAIRTSHNAPTPELLDACDRLGMLVMDENRETGVNPQELGELDRFIRRDRNHPCVVIWSLGNEEWIVEGSPKGARIMRKMQTLARRLDPTRPDTVAISGSWGRGSSTTIGVMGFNYFTHGDNDAYHRQFPDKPSVATEDASTFSTRGIYVADPGHQHLTAYDVNKPDWGLTAEESWTHYAARPYVAGLFQWTGFDYRGEETPFGWPAISSQFGILDTCGFPKDNFYYYQAWWSDQPVLHLLPHWTWPGREGQVIDVWAFSNCQEVELFLNGVSQGRKTMPRNSHLEWPVKYSPGVLLARGYTNGREILSQRIETTGAPAAVRLTPDRATLHADGADVSIITVSVLDDHQRTVPDAANLVHFAVDGPGKIIGVGNGDPSSHEPDVYVPQSTLQTRALEGWTWQTVPDGLATNLPQTAVSFDDANWAGVSVTNSSGPLTENQSAVFRCHFQLSEADLAARAIELNFGMIDDEGVVWVNGQKAGESHDWQVPPRFEIKDLLHPGANTLAVAVKNRGGSGGLNNGASLTLQSGPGAVDWQRHLFSGLAQILVQTTTNAGPLTLTATSPGLTPATLVLQTESVPLPPAIAGQ